MKVVLQQPEARFRDSIQALASDARVAATCNVPHPYPGDGAERWLRIAAAGWRSRSHYAYLVRIGELPADACCGVISISVMPEDRRCGHLDYWLGASFQGRGIGTAAVAAALTAAHDRHDLHLVFSGCMQDNVASRIILEKNGFRVTHAFINNGIYGRKFLGATCWRLRRELRPSADALRDPSLREPSALEITAVLSA